MGFVAYGGGEGVEGRTAILDVRVAEHGGEEFDSHWTKIFVVGAICSSEDVAEGQDGNCSY